MSAMIVQLCVKISITLIKFQLFMILARFQLEFTLRTQVVRSGQVYVLGVDKYNKEVLRFAIGASAASNHNTEAEHV